MSTIIYSKDLKQEEKIGYTHTHPFVSKIKDRKVLNHPSSSKKTFHVVLDMRGSGITYKEGDAVGILPTNKACLVKRVLQTLDCNSDTLVTYERTSTECSIEQCLSELVNLSKVTPKLLSYLFEKLPNNVELQSLTKKENKESRKAFIEAHDVVTCLSYFKATELDPQLFCNTLPPQLPRFYSVASSQKMHPDELHLLVATFSYKIQDESREGIGSDFLCYQSKLMETPIPLYVQKNEGFSLPSDPNIPIIMVGPGTGLAAFRAFIQERVSLKTKTNNWLFFGERNEDFDYYYKQELEQYSEKGLLRIDTAFSRDQKDKVYVQHKMLLHSKEIAKWIEEGAYFYVCGDAKKMSKDVHSTLVKIFEKELGLSTCEAKEKLQQLRREKRCQADVY